MTTVGQVEIDGPARSVLERWWPDVPRWSDIRDVDGDDLPAHDVLSGGFPCQSYSVAGQRGGLVSDRGALWWQFHRLIAECRPTWVIGENVPGLISSNGGADFGSIVESLIDLGYGVVWRTFDAQHFGVAQRRRRLFFVGNSGGKPRPEILALAEGSAGHPAPSRNTETQEPGGAGSTNPSPRGSDITSNETVIGFSPKARSPAIHAVIDGSPTLRAGGPVAVSQPHLRRMTLTEHARLQGFPDNWNDHLSNAQGYRLYGNAVCVPVAEWIGHRLATCNS
jgi:DNA (cytosine-5)-methyltransferase 1